MKQYIFINNNTKTCLLMLTISGIITGLICGFRFQHLEICMSISENFFALPVDAFQYFLEQSLLNLLFLIVVFVTGFSLCGIPVILFFLFVKGFKAGMICFSVCHFHHMKGVLALLFVQGPVMILDFVCLFMISSAALHFSYRLISLLHHRNNKQTLLPLMNHKFTRLVSASVLCLLTKGFQSTYSIWMIELFQHLK